MEIFELYRPLESFGMVAAVFFGQIIRGAILAFLLYPFYDTYMKTGRGWLLLFGLLFGLKVLVVVIFIPTALIELKELLVGIPEITAQTLIFSVLFFAWELRRSKKAAVS
jgi:predicted PurR-regulated permease PerM